MPTMNRTMPAVTTAAVSQPSPMPIIAPGIMLFRTLPS